MALKKLEQFGRGLENMTVFDLFVELDKVNNRLSKETPYWDRDFLLEEQAAILHHTQSITRFCMKEIYIVRRHGEFVEIRRDCDRLCQEARIRIETLKNRIKFEGLDLAGIQKNCPHYPNPPCNITVKGET